MDQLPTIIPPRNFKLVANSFEILSNYHIDDFVIIFYYINIFNAKIKIYRVDSDHGWGQSLTIRLFSLLKKSNLSKEPYYEDIILGSSEQNNKEIDITTTISLQPIPSIQTFIPQIIMQTNDKNVYDNLQHYNAVQSLINLNPSYTYMYFNGKDRRKYIKENMSIDVLKAYDTITSNTFKSDFFRYIFLYKTGGCYFDHKFLLKKSLLRFISPTDSYMLCTDLQSDALQNGSFFSKPKESFLYDCIQKIVSYTQSHYYGPSSHSPTGPKLLYECASHLRVDLHFPRDSPSKNYKDELIIHRPTNQIIGHRYYNQYYQKRNHTNYTNYGHLYDNRLIYSHQRLKLPNYYTIIVYPTGNKINHSDRFHFKIQNDHLLCQRIDKSYGWELELKIQIINEITNQMTNLWIGSSHSFKKIVQFPHSLLS